MTRQSLSRLDIFIEAVLGRKAEDVIVLDVHALTSLADTFIICSGRSNRQVSAIAENAREALKKMNIRPLNAEGLKEGQWVLMDYGDVIIHVFHDPVRRFYDLEGLWADAPRVETSKLKAWRREQNAEASRPPE
jgi:ribosome-associated protein